MTLTPASPGGRKRAARWAASALSEPPARRGSGGDEVGTQVGVQCGQPQCATGAGCTRNSTGCLRRRMPSRTPAAATRRRPGRNPGGPMPRAPAPQPPPVPGSRESPAGALLPGPADAVEAHVRPSGRGPRGAPARRPRTARRPGSDNQHLGCHRVARPPVSPASNLRLPKTLQIARSSRTITACGN